MSRSLAVLLLPLVVCGCPRQPPAAKTPAGESSEEARYDGRTIPEWIEALENPDVDTRRQATAALAGAGAKAEPARAWLVDRGLRDSDVLVRAQAARALGAIGPLAEAAIPDLAAALHDAAPRVRLEAARALGAICARAEVTEGALTKLLRRETDAEVLREGRRALKALLETRAPEDADEPIRGQTLTQWRATLTQAKKPARRRQAAQAIAQYGRGAEAALAELTQALTDADAQVRYYASRALGRIGVLAAAATPALVKALSDAAPIVRRGSAQALGEIGREHPAAIAALGKLLADPTPRVRAAAAQALGAIGPAAQGQAQALASLLRDADPEVRLRAARAVGELGPGAGATVAPGLMRALGDRGLKVRQQALRSLTRLGPAVVPILTKAVYAAGISSVQRLRIVGALGALGPAAKSALPVLTKALEDPDEKIRLEAARSIARIKARTKTR